MKERWEIVADLINKNKYTSYCEVGCRDGKLVRNLIPLVNLDKLVMVDIDDSVIDKSLGEFIHKSSVEASKDFKDDEFDIIFIDAGHGYNDVREDIEAWLPKVRKGGILCGHDFRYSNPGVEVAVREVFSDVNLVPDALTEERFILHPAERKLTIDTILYIWWVNI